MMPPTTLRQACARGFTLLEIIVVVAVVGVLASLAVLAVGDGGRRERLQTAAERLQLAAELGAQEAVLMGRPVGIAVTRDSYRLRVFQSGAWADRDDDKIYQPHRLSTGFELVVEAATQVADESPPSMIFLPDGEAFLMPLALRDEITMHEVHLIPEAGSYALEERVLQ